MNGINQGTARRFNVNHLNFRTFLLLGLFENITPPWRRVPTVFLMNVFIALKGTHF